MSQPRVDFGNAIAESRRLRAQLDEAIAAHEIRHKPYPSTSAIARIEAVVALLRRAVAELA